MSDVPAECFILLALLLGLIAWKRASTRPPSARSWLLVIAAGVMVGLATLSKLNGVLSGLVLATWIVLAIASRAFPPRSKWFLGSGTLLAAGVAFATFVVLNPFLTAHPPEPVTPEIASGAHMTFLGRTLAVYEHRSSVSKVAMRSFPNDALPTLASRVAVMLVQGFGRFGPIAAQGRSDSTIRFDFRQDRGAILWLPIIVAGLIAVFFQGWNQFRHGKPPLAWLILLYFTVVGLVVTSFLPLAWDRYMMSIQPPSALVGAVLVVACADRLGKRRSPSRESSP